MEFLPAWLNPYDALIVFALLVGVALGFIRGLVRMVLSLLVLYLGAVLAVTFYITLGRGINYIFGLPREINEGMAFLLILVVTSVVINFVLRRTYKDTELPGVRQIDQLGGMIIGFFVTAIWIGFGILVLAFLLGASVTASEGARQNLIGYFRSSSLIPIFYDFLSVALATLRPWMPKGLPPELFTFRL
jgi:uncharacterized membrane protein required for colicin V production